ncbi:MAG: hypothetical protein K8I60_02900 [Anaerolineae bacterium]|nr:hypothetical protein [Anaerolineae bacterium]
MKKWFFIVGVLVLAVLLVSCTGTSSPTQVAELPTTTANLTTAVPETSNPQALTETAIADSVNALFAGTAAAAGNATQYAITNPSATPTPDPEQDPAVVASLWFAGFLTADGTATGRYTCAEEAKTVSQAGLVMGVLSLFATDFLQGYVPGASSEIDMTHTTYTVIQQGRETATVQIGGEMTFALSGGFVTRPVDGKLGLVYEDNRWKVCGPLQ